MAPENLTSEEIERKDAFKTQFADIKQEDWYYQSTEYAYTKGLFNGTSENKFAPNETMNRGMIVTVLHRLADEVKLASENTFNDVENGAYYQEAVKWAMTSGVVTGTGNGKFSPEKDVTREDIVVMLYRFAKLNGDDVTADSDFTKYEDAENISDYAKEAFA